MLVILTSRTIKWIEHVALTSFLSPWSTIIIGLRILLKRCIKLLKEACLVFWEEILQHWTFKLPYYVSVLTKNNFIFHLYSYLSSKIGLSTSFKNLLYNKSSFARSIYCDSLLSLISAFESLRLIALSPSTKSSNYISEGDTFLTIS